MKVTHISSYPPWKGGIADYMEMLLGELVEEEGLYNSVISFESAEGENVSSILDKSSPLSFWRAFQEIRKQEPDVLHIQHELNLYGRLNFLFLAFLLLLWKPFTDTKIVTTMHTYIDYDFKLEKKQLLRFIGYKILTFNLIFWLSDRIVVHNSVIQEKIGREKVEVIPHGVKQLE